MTRQSLYIVLAINVVAWLMVMALFFAVQVVQAAPPEITEVRWIPWENNKVRVLGKCAPNDTDCTQIMPDGKGLRVYVRTPNTIGNRRVQVDGSFRFNKQGVYPPPCEVHLLPQGGEPGPVHPVTDPRDFLTGEAIRHECMPEPTKSIFEAHEFGAGVRWLMRPVEWCRWEPDGTKAIYWPRPASGDCTPDVGHQEMVIALDDARSSALANGADPNWIHPTTDLLIPEFTVDALTVTGGALSSAGAAGHVILSKQVAESTAPGGYCTTVHEFQHANIQYSIFPSMTGDIWGTGIWPEALAMLHMRDVAACADFWDELHSPWNILWVTGYYGPDQRRQMGLFFGYLGDRYGINWYDWMLDHHATLLTGDEITALRDAIVAAGGAPTDLDREWTRFVSHYNERDNDRLPGISALGPPDTFSPLAGFDATTPVVGNGMLEGDTKRFSLAQHHPFKRTYETSPRCPTSPACFVLRYPLGHHAPPYCTDGGVLEVSTQLGLFAGDYTVTVASLAGNAHFREITYTTEPTPPGSQWPAQDLNDPWLGAACQ